MTKEEWKVTEQRVTNPCKACKLLVDGYRITVILLPESPYKNVLAVYVNGEIRGEWLVKQSEECTRFWYHTTKSMIKPSCKGKKRWELLTALGKTEEELLLHRYSPYYPSFAAFKRQLIARNKDIQLLDE